MITFKKTEGVQTSNHKTCIWIQEVILDFKRQTNSPIGKVVIDAEKITFYKFGIVMGIAVLFLSQIFTYGENLEKEVEGLI